MLADYPQLALIDTPIRRLQAFADELVPPDRKACAEPAALLGKALSLVDTVAINGGQPQMAITRRDKPADRRHVSRSSLMTMWLVGRLAQEPT